MRKLVNRERETEGGTLFSKKCVLSGAKLQRSGIGSVIVGGQLKYGVTRSGEDLRMRVRIPFSFMEMLEMEYRICCTNFSTDGRGLSWYKMPKK